MRAHQAVYPVQTICRVLEVSKSGYYAWRRREPSARAQADAALTVRIQEVHKDSRRTYGSPRIHAELQEEGRRVGRKRVARLMRGAGLEGASRRRFVKTTQRAEDARPAPDLVDRDFAASRLSAEKSETPELATALVNGVEGDFACGWGMYITMVGDLIELDDMSTVSEAQQLNRRQPSPGGIFQVDDCTGRAGILGSYIPLSRARWTADNLVRLLEGWTEAQVPQREARMARALMLSGFSISALGSGFCSGALDLGKEMSSVQLFAEAEKRFNRAIDIATRLNLTSIVQGSTLGRARVRLFQGNTAGALSDAEAIPPGFVFQLATAPASYQTWNWVWWNTWGGRRLQVPAWIRSLTVEGVPDPRVRAINVAGQFGSDGRPYWGPAKYQPNNSPLPVARWAEAQLIIAEIAGGQRAVSIINTLRDRYGLPHFSSTDQAKIRDMVFEERRRELYLEGFRAYDTRRANLALYPPVDALYAEGSIKFGTYGTSTCVPLPAVEKQNNPNTR